MFRQSHVSSKKSFIHRSIQSHPSLFRYNLFTGCPNAKTCTLILRGGAEQFIEETERSLHDAIMIVRRTLKNDAVVAGGGAIEMELSKHLRNHAR